MTEITIHQIEPSGFDHAMGDLDDILQACVQDGASVGFILLFPL